MTGANTATSSKRPMLIMPTTANLCLRKRRQMTSAWLSSRTLRRACDLTSSSAILIPIHLYHNTAYQEYRMRGSTTVYRNSMIRLAPTTKTAWMKR